MGEYIDRLPQPLDESQAKRVVPETNQECIPANDMNARWQISTYVELWNHQHNYIVGLAVRQLICCRFAMSGFPARPLLTARLIHPFDSIDRFRYYTRPPTEESAL